MSCQFPMRFNGLTVYGTPALLQWYPNMRIAKLNNVVARINNAMKNIILNGLGADCVSHWSALPMMLAMSLMTGICAFLFFRRRFIVCSFASFFISFLCSP